MSLAAAAAGAALRSATASAAPSTPGTIPTKRMLQRRASYSSASDVPRRSLSSRRFRNTPVRPAAPISSSDDDDDDDDGIRVPRRCTSARSFPTTMRGAAPRRRSASDSDVGRPIPAPESAASTASELESIAEDATLQLSDPEDDDTFEVSRKASVAAARRTLTAGSPPKHTPPSRSVSPAKSALRHEPSARKARVSFSDEDSVASFSAYVRAPLVLAGSESPRAPLPVFARASRGEAEVSHEVVLTLTPPTPRDEEPPPVPPGGFPGGDESEDSDSGESIYSDAYEALPAPAPAPVVLNAPEILLPPPPAPPPPPPDRSTQYPSPASSDTASIRSVSSFRRLSPRRPGVTMLRSLRAAAPAAAPQSKLSKPSPPFRSRFADDSDDDDDDDTPAAAKLQRKRTASVAGSARVGFWRGVFGRRRPQQTGEPEAWGVTTVIASGGPDSEARKKRFTRLRRLLRLG